MIKMHVIGIQNYNKLILRLGRAFTDKEQERAIKVGLKVTERDMKMTVPRKSERLVSSIKTEKDRKLSRTGQVTVRVGRTRKKNSWRGQGYHAHLVEHGTKSHVITAGEGKFLPIYGGFGKSVPHPGSRALRPFSKSIDRTKNRVIQNTENELWKIIFKEWNKGGVI